MVQNGQKQQVKKPGSKFLTAGAVVAVLGAIFCIMGFATTHTSLVPGTFRTVETQGAPTPFAWMILILGVVLLIVGFCKRLLAAVEK
jgi:hypothetical protein